MSSYCAISPTSSAPWLRRRGRSAPRAGPATLRWGARHRARLAFQLHTELGEERFGSLEVLDDDEHVVHSLNHVVLLALWAASVAALYLMSGAGQSFSLGAVHPNAPSRP